MSASSARLRTNFIANICSAAVIFYLPDLNSQSVCGDVVRRKNIAERRPQECTEFISPASLEASELCTLGEGQKSECSSSDSSSSCWRSEVGAGVLPGIWRNVVAYGGL